MRLLFGFPDEKQFKGACPKSRRDDRPQTGAQAPGSSAAEEEAPTGRQRQMQVEIKQVRYSVAPFGAFVLLMLLYRGLAPPSVFFRTFGAFPQTTIFATITFQGKHTLC